MATASEQELLSAGVTQDQINSETALGKGGLAHGVNVDPQDVSGFLSKYKPTASGVFQAGNVQQTMQAPLAAPDYSDPLKLRDYFMNSPDIVQNKTDLAKLNTDLATLKGNARNQQNYLENQTTAMPVITGEQASQQRLADTEQNNITDQINAKTANLNTFLGDANDKFQLAYAQANDIKDLIRQTGGKANIKYTDSFEQATSKAQKYMDKQAKKQKEDAEKDALKSMALSAGVKSSGSAKDIRKRLEKVAKQDRQLKDQMNSLDLQLKQLDVTKSKQSLAGTSGAGKESALRQSLTEAVYNGTTSREAAKAIYSQAYPKNDSNWIYQAAPDNYEQNVVGKSSTPLTGSQKDDLATMDTISSLAKQVQSMYQSSGTLSGVGGLGQGSASQFLFGQLGIGSPAGQQTRDLVGNIQGTIAKLRGGTSFTPNEQALLERYTPTVNETPASINQKLQDLTAFIQSKKQNTLNYSGNLSTANQDNSNSSQQMSTIPVIEVKTGRVGSIPANEFDPSLYIKQ